MAIITRTVRNNKRKRAESRKGISPLSIIREYFLTTIRMIKKFNEIILHFKIILFY